LHAHFDYKSSGAFMSFSPSTLSAIQQAGQSLHTAGQAVADAVRAQAERMVATVASQPFNPESDDAYAQFRTVARMAHDLQALEEQLKNLYMTASDMVTPELAVLVALPGRAARQRAAADDANAGAEDAIVKPAKASKTRHTASRGTKPVRLTPNDNKVLQYLQSALQTEIWTALTVKTIAQGAGIPLGSVTISISKVLASGAVQKGAKGMFRLA
jgi:hypothetical protein